MQSRASGGLSGVPLSSVGVPMEVVQASPVKIPEPGTAAECANNTVLPVTVADAAYLGNLTTVRKFLSDGGAVDALCPARDNGTLLMAAAVGGHAGLTRLLLNRRANIELQNSAGLTPLMGASQQVGNTEVIEMLIRAGAQVERSNPRDGATAILYAAERGDADAAQALLKAGANVDAAKSDGGTALMAASHQGRLDVVRALISAQPALDKQNDEGATALMGAAQQGHAATLAVLLQASPPSPPFFPPPHPPNCTQPHICTVHPPLFCSRRARTPRCVRSAKQPLNGRGWRGGRSA